MGQEESGLGGCWKITPTTLSRSIQRHVQRDNWEVSLPSAERRRDARARSASEDKMFLTESLGMNLRSDTGQSQRRRKRVFVILACVMAWSLTSAAQNKDA